MSNNARYNEGVCREDCQPTNYHLAAYCLVPMKHCEVAFGGGRLWMANKVMSSVERHGEWGVKHVLANALHQWPQGWEEGLRVILVRNGCYCSVPPSHLLHSKWMVLFWRIKRHSWQAHPLEFILLYLHPRAYDLSALDAVYFQRIICSVLRNHSAAHHTC